MYTIGFLLGERDESRGYKHKAKVAEIRSARCAPHLVVNFERRDLVDGVEPVATFFFFGEPRKLSQCLCVQVVCDGSVTHQS